MKQSHVFAAILAVGAITFAGCASSHDHSGHSHSSASTKPYPLNTCIVTDDKLGGPGDFFAFTYKGQELKTCCEGCREDFDKAPAKYLKKLTAAK